MKRMFFFFVFTVFVASCRNTQEIQTVFIEYRENIDTISFKKIKDILAYIQPQTVCPLNESRLHIGGSSFTNRMYLMDINGQAIVDSMQLNATDLHTIFYYYNKSYLYNATSGALYNLSYSKKIDTTFIGTYDFSLKKNEYMANYNRKKFLYPNKGNFSLLVAYGDNSSQPPNYLGDYVFKLIPETHKPFGKYSSADYKEKKVYRGVVFDMDTAGNVFYCSEMADRLIKINMEGKALDEIKFSDYTALKYDNRKKGDLAYLRKYEANVEFNCDLSVIGQHVYLLKRKAKEKLQTPDKYDLFIFDLDLNPVGKLSGLPDLVPFITKDRNAICLFNMKKNEMYKIH